MGTLSFAVPTIARDTVEPGSLATRRPEAEPVAERGEYGEEARRITTIVLAGHRIGLTQHVVPVGPEFQVNDYTIGNQRQPVVSGTPEGFAVSWRRPLVHWPGERCEGNENCEAVVRWFNADAVPTSGESYVGGDPGVDAINLDVFVQSDGDVVLTFAITYWDDFDWFNASTNFCELGVDPCFPAGADPTDVGWSTVDHHMRVAGITSYGSNGDRSVAVWADYDQLLGRVLAQDGTYDGEVFSLHAESSEHLDIAVAWTGRFMVVWEGPDSQQGGIWARLFAEDGSPLSSSFLVNVDETGHQGRPAIACNALGDFVVVWRTATDVLARRFWANGSPREAGALRLNELPVHMATRPDVIYDNIQRGGIVRGAFLAVWAADDGDDSGVFGQLVLDSGEKLGGQFPVNSHTQGRQSLPQVAITRSNDFVVVWEDSSAHDGDGMGVFGQRFTGPLLVDGFETGGTANWSYAQ